MENFRFTYDSPSHWGLESEQKVQLPSAKDSKKKLLSQAVRVHHNLFPEIASKLESASKNLSLPHTPAAFITPEATANAFCIPWSNNSIEEFAVVMTSGLVNLLTSDELEFVIGHEIGHFFYRHFTYPKPLDEHGLGLRLATLNLQRAAEISADRVGVIATQSAEIGCSAMIKTACGLGTPHLRPHLPSILDQFRELTDEVGGDEDSAFDSHPMFTIRVRSMIRFSTSDIFIFSIAK